MLVLTACLDSTVETTKVEPGSSEDGGGNASNSTSAPVFAYASTSATYALNVPFVATPTITYSGTGLSFAIIGDLPTGLSINASTGAITGIPTSEPGDSIYMIIATNSAGSSFKTLQLLTGPIFEYSATQYDYIVGNAFTAILPTVTYPTSGAILYSVSPALPTGMSINTFTGEISGTPTAASVATEFTITATANGQSNSIVIDFNEAGPPVVAYAATYYYIRNTAFSQAPTITYGGSGLNFALSAGSLPNGLALNSSTGTISGTPTGNGDQSVVIVVDNAYGPPQSHAINFIEVGPPIFASTSFNGTFQRTNAFTQTVETSLTFPAAASVDYTISPALPRVGCQSLSFNSTTALISGTVAATSSVDSSCAGTYTITATNTADPNLSTSTVTVTLTEAGPPRFAYAVTDVDFEYQTPLTIPAPTIYFSGTLASPAFAVVGTPLPTGLALNQNTGEITGTPQASPNPQGDPVTITISLENAEGVSVWTINFEEIGSPRVSYSNKNLTYYRNDTGTFPRSLVTPTIEFCNTPCSILSTAPGQLNVDPGTGEISLITVETTQQTHSFDVNICDGNGQCISESGFTYTEACNDTAVAFQDFGGGAGTAGDPWLVCTETHLKNLDSNPSFLDDYFKQTANIDMSSVKEQLTSTCFKGGYDGNHKIISNLKIYNSGGPGPLASKVGLFNCLEDFDYVVKLTLLNFTAWGEEAVGALASSVSTTLSSTRDGRIAEVQAYNTFLREEKTPAGYIGGLVGMVQCHPGSPWKIYIEKNIFHGTIQQRTNNGLMSAFYNSNVSTSDCTVIENNAAFLQDVYVVTNGNLWNHPGGAFFFDHNDTLSSYLGLGQINNLVNLDPSGALNNVRPGTDSRDSVSYLDDNYWLSIGLTIGTNTGQYSYSRFNRHDGQNLPGPIIPIHLCSASSAQVMMDPAPDDQFQVGRGGGFECQ